MSHRSFLLLVLVVPMLLHGQTVQWMRQGGIGGEGRAVAVDADGNCFVGGQVGDPALFDQDTVASHFADAFLSKYDVAGNIQWVRTAGGELIDQVNAIATDAEGNTYATGSFRTNGLFPTVDFDATVITGSGSSDLFLAKYDTDGTLLWVRHGGGGLNDEGRGVALTTDGHVAVSGSFQGSAVFGNDTLVSAGLSDVVLLAYDTAGSLLWSTRAGGSGDDAATKVTALASGDVVVVGDFQNSVLFGGTTLSASGLADVFVARFSGNGQPVWAKRAGSAIAFALDQAFDIATAPNGDVVFCGEIAGAADFDGFTIVPNGNIDLFIARYDDAGNALWVRHAGGPQQDHAYGVSVDDNGNSYLTGQADDGAMTVFDSIMLAPFGNEAVFLAKYDAGGAVQWVQRYAPGLGRAVAVLDDGCLYFSGGASGIVGQPAFDSIPWQYTDRAIFTARFCEAGTTTIAEGIVDGMTLRLYPNPASSHVFLNNSATCTAMVFDATGRRVLGERVAAYEPLFVGDLVPGPYVLQLAQGASITNMRFLKE